MSVTKLQFRPSPHVDVFSEGVLIGIIQCEGTKYTPYLPYISYNDMFDVVTRMRTIQKHGEIVK